MAFSTIPTAGLSTGGANFRNLIINGDMSIAQRGTSVTGVTSGTYKTCDRFRLGISGAGTWTITQATDAPSGQGFTKSFKYDCTTANASLSAGSVLYFLQKIEGNMLQSLKKGTSNAESVTLSFWVKSNKTGTYTAEIYDAPNNRSISKEYTISSSNTWEKKTITFAGDTSGTIDDDNSEGLFVAWWLGTGSDYNSGTLQTSWGSVVSGNRCSSSNVNLADTIGNTWQVTGVQLEVGTSASDFEFLPYDVNLQRCQRYYEQTYNVDVAPGTNTPTGQRRFNGSTDGSSNMVYQEAFAVTKRAAPTQTFYQNNGTSGSWKVYASGLSTTTSNNNWDINQTRLSVYFTFGSSKNFVSGYIEGHWTADAEL